MTDARTLACRRRLADGPAQRWGWAIGSGLPLVGLPVLVWHGVTRRTCAPLLFGLASLASVGFAVLTVIGVPSAPTGRRQSSSTPPSALLLLAATASFAFGHRLGQDRAARDAEKWLRLDA